MTAEARKVAEFVKLETAGEKLRLICSRVLKCYQGGRTVAVHVATRQEAEELDDMLWTFSDTAFIAHVQHSQIEEPVLEPVVICCGSEPIGEADVLVEASGGPAEDGFTRFEHVCDFAELYDDELREASRRRFAAYKDAGYRMRYIK